jgi:4-amino-4-deoxy-L-arabinose transferase-like glycosyltransferase
VSRLRGRIPAPLAGILLVTLITSVAWALMVPPFQGPDEMPHFAYVQRIVETGRILPGDPDPERQTFSTELGTAASGAGVWPLFGNRSTRPAWSAAEERAWQRAASALPDGARADGTGRTTRPEAGITFDASFNNPPTYYLLEAVPYLLARGGSTFDQLYVMRLSNIPLRLAEIVLVWLIAAELLAGLWARTMAAGVVALQPVAGFVGATVNPDNLLRVEWALFMLVAIHLIRAGPTRRRVALIALIALASALTHLRGVPLVPVAFLVVLLALWRHMPEHRRRIAWAGAGVAVSAVAAFAALGVIWWSGRRAPPEPFRLFEFASYLWQFYLPKLWFMTDMVGIHYTWDGAFVRQFFALFGYLETEFPTDVYVWLRVLSVLGLIGFVAAAVHRRAELRRQWEIVLALGAPLVALLLWLHFVSYRHLLILADEPLLQGRYILPLLPLFGVAIAFTFQSLPRAAGLRLGATLLAAAALFHVAALGITMARFYV